MNKIVLSALILILLLASSIAAEKTSKDAAENGLKWLLSKQSSDGNFNGNVADTSLSTLAMSSLGSTSEAEKALDWVKTQQSNQGCFPKANCRTKDTSFASLALKKFEQDTSKIPDWLRKAQSAALVDSWWLQVAASADGQCKLAYTKLDDQKANLTVRVNNSRFPSCGNGNWLNLNTCLEQNLIASNPSLNIDVDCRTLSPSTIISLIYSTSNNYYLVQDEHSPQANIIIKNGCFGIGYRGACNYDASLYANWAIKELQADTDTLFYLKQNYDASNTIHNSLLYIITADEQYLNELTRRQRTDGSWDNNNVNTAIAILALKKSSGNRNQIDNATSYLIKRQQSDGSWGNVQDTAMVLYAAFGDVAISISEISSCSDGKKNGDEEGVDCGGSCPRSCSEAICNNDDTCDAERGEDFDNCPNDCKKETSCSDGKKNGDEEGVDCGGSCSRKCICNFDGVCDIDAGEDPKQCPSDCQEAIGPCDSNGVCDSEEGETSSSCPDDCLIESEEEKAECGNNICETTEDSSSCPQDCEKKRSSLIWWILIFVILIIVAFLVYYYRKFGKKKLKTQEFGFGAFGGSEKRIEPGVGLGNKKSIDEELERSIREAEKLIRK